MDTSSKLQELNLSEEEMGRFSKAFKDDKFREMFREYIQELSEPENRRRYEEEIGQLEKERGNHVEFIRPTPFKVIRTSAAGKQRCFINICGNEKIRKPEVKSGLSEDGRRGQCWSLPHSLHPGRAERDPEGNTFMTYDVVFHPDTLRLASKSKAFMDMVYDAAVDGVQRAFEVNLDKNKVKEMKTKYKGTPRTCVIRRPIPGCGPQDRTPGLDVPQLQMESDGSPPSPNSRDAQQLNNLQFEAQKNQEPAKPDYTVKYRSTFDLQDFRCSRDSAQSPRPKEILITVDLPLLTSVRDTSLEVNEKSLLLESRNPAYRLHLPLAYLVDDDKGEAKFNKHTRQLTVTLPVRPTHFVEPFPQVSDAQRADESPEELRGIREHRGGKGTREKNKEDVRTDEHEGGNQGNGKELVKNSDEEQKSNGKEEKSLKMKRKNKETEEGETGAEVPNWDSDGKQEKLQESKEEGGRSTGKGNQSRGFEERSAPGNDYCQVGLPPVGAVSAQETVAVREKSPAPETENQDILIPDKKTGLSEEAKEGEPTSSLESTEGPEKAEQDASLPSSEKPQISACMSFPPPETAQSRGSEGDVRLSGRTTGSGQVFVADGAGKRRETSQDDPPALQVLQTSGQDNKPPAAASLREINDGGEETLIHDQATSAGLVFQNKLIYELD